MPSVTTLLWSLREEEMPFMVRLVVGAYCAIWLLTLIVFLWAMAVEGHQLLKYLSAFIGE